VADQQRPDLTTLTIILATFGRNWWWIQKWALVVRM